MMKCWREIGLWTVAGFACVVLCWSATHGQSGRVKRKPDQSSPPASNANQSEKADNKQTTPRVPETVDGPNGKEIVYSQRNVDRRAIILKKPPPHYPRTARNHEVEGIVILSAVLSSTGQVMNIRVIRGVPELNESAVDAAKQIKFEPAIKDGKPVAMKVGLEYTYRIY